MTLVSTTDPIDPGQDGVPGCRSHPTWHLSLRLQYARPLQGGHVQGRDRDAPHRTAGLHPGLLERVARRRADHNQGRHGQLEAANFGTIQHELLVFKSDLAGIRLPVDQDGNIIEDGPGINLVSDGDNLDPGKTQSRTVDLTQPGTYLFVCNIPGHFKAGMYSPVTVTP